MFRTSNLIRYSLCNGRIFFIRFKREFVPIIDDEFLALEQTTEIVAKITAKFRESIGVPEVCNYEGEEYDSLP